MSAITPADEQLHTPADDAHAQESFYFNWADPEGRCFGLTRIGYRFADRQIDGVLVTVRDGRRELVLGNVNLPFDGDHARIDVTDGLRAGGLSFTMEESLRRWRIRLEGRQELDLTWTAFTPAVDFGQEDALTGSTQRHFEQSGVVTGRARINGRETEIRGFGQRDKSWGVRDWANVRGWDWTTGQFGEDFAFNATQTVSEGRLVQAGYVYYDGTVHMIDSFDLRYTWQRDNVPGAATIEITDVDGERHVITARALAQVPLYKRGLLIQETHVAYATIHDGRSLAGHGVLEHAWHASPLRTLGRLPDLVPVVADAIKARVR